MPIKLSFLWCPQVTSKCLCVFSGGEWSEAEDTHEQKHNEKNEGQMSGLRRLQDGARYVMKE